MSHYRHLTTEEREKILVLITEGKSQGTIARLLGRNKSTISREIARNSRAKGSYSAVVAQKRYERRRKACRRKRLLENEALKKLVEWLFLGLQWSPEQIANRLAFEGSRYRISANTIYRGIYGKVFHTPEQLRSTGNRGAIRKLRHRGKRRNKKGQVETRGRFVISNRLEDRPEAAQNRTEIGHWEADTVLGKRTGPCLVAMTDRASRYLLVGKIDRKSSQPVKEAILSMLRELPAALVKSITPDRGCEFAKHDEITEVLAGLPFYFPDPGSPWQRGTNENTNGLLREYFPKSFDFSTCSDSDIAACVHKLNLRPRKCLNWLSPHEVLHGTLLHLT